MCYKVAGPPDRLDFTCPVCGEKTLYAMEENNGTRKLDNSLSRLIQYDIQTCRRLVKEITGVKLTLDESQFCGHCNPVISDPKLILILETKN